MKKFGLIVNGFNERLGE